MPSRDRAPPSYLTYALPTTTKKRKAHKPKIYDVDKILKSRTKAGGKQYQIRWKGFSAKWDTWEPEANMMCPALITAFTKASAKTPTKKAGAKKATGKKDATKKKGKKAVTSRTLKAKTARMSVSAKAPAKATKAAAAPKKAAPKKAAKAKAAEEVDEHAEVERGVAVLPTFTTSLKYIDLAQNSDKYYVIQVLYKDDDTWLYTRWGRSGSKGEQSVESMDREDAIAGFKDKFEDKTGSKWGGVHTQVDGKYWPITVAPSKDGEGQWEYYQDNTMDGKGPGWYNYLSLIHISEPTRPY
eukprot:TRINITY_DN9343_c0_g1_i1.p1 TRINITY_DN9343_c0_g1~~TRINITY_DN9343_c0_g1_i1.p1  ORF type:complete len:298 (+),score=93.88 TRINITY_DN9343_c0_g1_i1:59-952(+)